MLSVRNVTGEGRSLYTLDEELLAEEEPDLIVAQQLCDVCAVSFEDVRAVAERLPSKPKVISLDPTTLGDSLSDIRIIAKAVEQPELGDDLLQSFATALDDIKISLRDAGKEDGPARPSVAALEWLDPVFIGGHWVPQMIEIAGGMDFLGLPGERSGEMSWEEVKAAEPEIAILMQCGYDTARSADEAQDYADELRSIGAQKIFACDASAYFSRPGPRLVMGSSCLRTPCTRI